MSTTLAEIVRAQEDKIELLPEDRVGQLIRSSHPHAFRSGEWGLITEVTELRDRPCYRVQWDSRTGSMHDLDREDFWPVDDATADYQFAVVLP